MAVPSVFVIRPDKTVSLAVIEKTNRRLPTDRLAAYLETLAHNPGHTEEVARLPRLAPGGRAWGRVVRNLFKQGDADDWKHILLFPFEMINMAMGRRGKKK